MNLLEDYEVSRAYLGYYPLISDNTPRLHIKARAGLNLHDENVFMLDTGSPHGFFWRHDLGLDLSELEVIDEAHKTIWRGHIWRGGLYRLNFEFVASHGPDLSLKAVCFIPDEQEDHWENMPSLVGMSILEQIFFALDVNAEHFFFAKSRQGSSRNS